MVKNWSPDAHALRRFHAGCKHRESRQPPSADPPFAQEGQAWGARGCMMRCRGGASGAGGMRSRCCRAITSTNRWTAGFGCGKELSVAGRQTAGRTFHPFANSRRKDGAPAKISYIVNSLFSAAFGKMILHHSFPNSNERMGHQKAVVSPGRASVPGSIPHPFANESERMGHPFKLDWGWRAQAGHRPGDTKSPPAPTTRKRDGPPT